MSLNHINLNLFHAVVAILICREIAISALREWMAERGKRSTVKVGLMGKWKTATQMVAITMLLYLLPTFKFDTVVMMESDSMSMSTSSFSVFHQIFSQSHHITIAMVAFYLSTSLSVLSAWQYLWDAYPVLTNNTM